MAGDDDLEAFCGLVPSLNQMSLLHFSTQPVCSSPLFWQNTAPHLITNSVYGKDSV